MMLPQPPSVGNPMMPDGGAPPVSLPGGAGMPPQAAPPPPEQAGEVDRSKLPRPLQDILGRGDQATKSLLPPKGPKTLSRQEQQDKFQAMTRDTTWATTMAATATDPAAKYWLGLIGQYGWQGVGRYLAAMEQ